MTNPEQGYQQLPSCWDNLRREIVKGWGWFVYAAFVEEQQKTRDMPHLHVITLTNLPTRLNELALHCGFGFEAYNELLESWRAAWYVTKYASKNLKYAPRHFRRVRISQVWPRLPDPILPADYIPQEAGEKLKPYLQRCASQAGLTVAEMMERYDNHALDIPGDSR